MKQTALHHLLLVLVLCWTSASNAADRDLEISQLSPLDNTYMLQQRQSMQTLAARHLGRQFSGDKKRDLELLQALLDKGLVGDSQRRELQAMGIILGDILAKELGMHWVVYEDKIGRSRALRLKSTEHYLFPVTMIARRRQVANRQPVADIYQRAVDSIASVREPLPFE